MGRRPENEIPYPIEIPLGSIHNAIAHLAENHMKAYIRENIQTIIPNYMELPTSRYSIRFCRTNPELKPLGKVKGRKAASPQICGWHGDLVALIYDIEHKVRALIFEVKTGHFHMGRSQFNFYKGISDKPSDYMNELTDAKVIIVHVRGLDIDTGKGVAYFEPFRGYKFKEETDEPQATH